MGKVKILFVIPSYNSGGTVSSLESILNSTFSSKADIFVFTIKKSGVNRVLSPYEIGMNDAISALHSDYPSLSQKDKAKFFVLKILYRLKPLRSYINSFVECRTIKRIEKRNIFDYVVAFAEAYTTRFVSRFHCSRKIAWLHCDYAFAQKNNDYDYYKSYTSIVCVSQYTRSSFLKFYPLLSDRTIAIPNLFNSKDIIEKSKATIDDSRFDSTSFTLISVGRIAKVKRFYLIPHIATLLHKEDIDFKWYIIGDAREPEDLSRLKKAISENGMQDSVIYLGAKANPYPYFIKANLLVSLSISEACPMIFNEAKILHLPILSTNFGSSYEFIEEGVNGFITTIDDMPSFLIKLSRSKDILNTISQKTTITEDSNSRILSSLSTLFSLD